MTCNKKKYTSYIEALESGIKFNPTYDWRAYFCRTCLFWHNTRKRQGRNQKIIKYKV